jgi:hypothetical protein
VYLCVSHTDLLMPYVVRTNCTYILSLDGVTGLMTRFILHFDTAHDYT